ncbi:hypothetical protein SPHV1_2230030 [Novosphingobium sp. KN65.2]|nr:hypothetical protein SPHV1_2230030 [Novosphingobium sp. KN65.2]
MPRPGWVLPCRCPWHLPEARRGTHSRRLARRRHRRYPLCPRRFPLGALSLRVSPRKAGLEGRQGQLDPRTRMSFRQFKVRPERTMGPPKAAPEAGLGQLDLNVHASGQVELHQRVDGGGIRLHDVEQTLVGANLELLTRLLVDVRTAVHGELFDLRRKRNGAPNERAGTAGGVSDLASGLVEYAVVKRLEANADVLSFHYLLPMRKSLGTVAPNKFEPRPYNASRIRASPLSPLFSLNPAAVTK